ncbi:MAG: tRNA (adenosine(37)-N6)-threonylcarbamoyltransferase complex transferase subunit TsaD [Pseudomonadota bacterium]
MTPSDQHADPAEAPPSIVLGIETSCDETAAAIVRREAAGTGSIVSSVVRAQIEAHAPYGGVVPEIAARAHVEIIDTVVSRALSEADLAFAELDGIAATAGPGLLGGVLVGLVSAKALAVAARRPFIAINHLEGHALTVGLTDAVRPPYLLLLVSGGHTQTLIVEAVGRYRLIGTTLDDALGEAFDKTAKLLGLGFPGGPAVAAAARNGRMGRISLPRPMLGRPEPHFSFAGLKTAVRQQAQALAPLSDDDIANLCVAFEDAAADVVADRVSNAMEGYVEALPGAPRSLVVAGGVAANVRLREQLATLAEENSFHLTVPPVELCTDNAAMIAWAGAERLALGETSPLDSPARARWPLDPTAEQVRGAGVKASGAALPRSLPA